MIPRNITREHILSAINDINSDGTPWRRESTKFVLVFEDQEYPPKYVISIANNLLMERNDFQVTLVEEM